jgi:hypothetical protein
MDIALSMSFDMATGMTCGMLLGCDARQQTFVRQQLATSLRRMAAHPLLLVVLLTGQQQVLLSWEGEQLWRNLLRVEQVSGQTGVLLVSDDDATEITTKKDAKKEHR